MVRYLIVFFCCLLTIFGFAEEEELQEELILSTPDQLAILRNEPSYLIGGLISPLGGHPFLRQTDLVVKGAQNIALSRIYIPPYIPCSFPKHDHNQAEHDKKYLYQHLAKNYKGWQFFPHLRLQFNPKLMEVRLCEPNGATFDFQISESKATLASPPYAISNVAGDEPSGRYDPRNTRISYEDNGNKIVVYATDGTIRFYYKKAIATKTSYLFLLQKEILPNRKVLKYQYNERWQPTYVESLDPQERHVYGFLCISGSPMTESCHFTSSSGVNANYGYQRRPLQVKIKEKIKGVQHNEEFNFRCPPILTSVSSPFYRHETFSYSEKSLLNSYSGKNDVFILEYSGLAHEHYRVNKLFLPVAENDVFVPLYNFIYEPPIAGEKEGRTVVSNSDGNFTTYHFSKNLLTTSIDYYGQDGDLKKKKIFSWYENN